MPSVELAAHIIAQVASSPTSDVFVKFLSARLRRAIAAQSQGTDLDLFNEASRDPLRAWQLVSSGPKGTAGSLIVPPTPVSETTIDALIATQDAYGARRLAEEKHEDAVENHQSKYLDEWQWRAKALTQKPTRELLESLWDSSFSWRDIARLLKVSVPAIQKWRSGQNISPKNFARLRDFIAAYDMVAANKPDVDVAGWLDVPLLSDVPVTLQQLWTEGSPSLFFEYALGDLPPEAALDQFDSEWRQRSRDDGFETFAGTDGHLSIRTKNR